MGEAPQSRSDGAKAVQTEESHGQASQQSSIVRRVPRARGAGVLAQNDVFDPVQSILNLPVSARDPGELCGFRRVAACIVHALGVGLRASGAGALHLDDAGQLRPRGEGSFLRCSEDPDPTPGTPIARTLALVILALRRGRCAELCRRSVEVGLVALESKQVPGSTAADQSAGFFVQCSASAVRPVPANSACSISSSIAWTRWASLCWAFS